MVRSFDDDPTGDDVMSSATASATPTANSTLTATPSATTNSTPTATVTSSASMSPRTDAGTLPHTGGVPLLPVAAGILLVGCGVIATMVMRRTS
jgi:hypothetical protein